MHGPQFDDLVQRRQIGIEFFCESSVSTCRLLALLTLLAAFTIPARGAAVDEVDPFIGTAGEGNTCGHVSVLPITGVLRQPSSLVSTGKSNEAASPGYYTVRLAPWDVQVELTAPRHVALHRHRFPAHE